MLDPDPNPATPDPLEAAAAAWLSRLDRGLTAAEQDDYLQWRQQDPRHAAAVARLERAWVGLDRLSAWRPTHSPQPNPDLLATPSPVRRRFGVRRWVAAAAAVTVLVATGAVGWFAAAPRPASLPPSSIGEAGAARRVLEDGSVVDLNRGAEVGIAFSPEERRVLLVRGEAYFTVAKNPARPFIVQAGSVSIRAVGTAFNVRLAPDSVEVLVTEGRVEVAPPVAESAPAADRAPMVGAGERLFIETGPRAAPPRVDPVSTAQVAAALAWQVRRLDFVDTPLSEALVEFNRQSPIPLVLGERDLGEMRLGGSFRADNLEGFLRLLEGGFGIRVERQPDRLILRRAGDSR
jgi:transmembrane sensor